MRGHDLGRRIARAVVDDDDFEFRGADLCAERVERAGEKRGPIAGRDDHRKFHEAAAKSERAMRSEAPACAA